MAETKTKAFRADEETIESLDSWAEAKGLRNNEILPALIRAAQMAEEKGKLTGRSTEIDNFSSLLSQLEAAYVASLNLASNADERIKNEFAAQLERQDKTISNLQEQLAEAKQQAAAAKAELAEQKDANNALITAEAEARKAEATAKAQVEKSEEQAAKAQNTADELTSLTTSQAKEIAELKKELASLDALKKQLADSQAELAKAKGNISRLDENQKDLKAKLDAAKQEAKAEAERIRGRYDEKLEVAAERAANEKQAAVLAAKEEAQKKIEAITEKYQVMLTSKK